MKLRIVLLLSIAVAASSLGIAYGAGKERPPVDSLPVPPGATMEQVRLGDRIFHGEAAEGKCYTCHGWDAKGTPTGNDLTLGMWIWSDGSMRMLKNTMLHNIAAAPGVDGNLTPADLDAAVAYVWAIGHQKR